MTHPPIFKTIFGSQWENLPKVMRLHYANTSFSNDQYICNGKMNVQTHILMRLVAPISHFLKGLPIVNKSNIPVRVLFKSSPNNSNLHFIRTFHLSNKKTYVFHSEMVPSGGNNITEITHTGLCWRSRFIWQDNKIMLMHNGYAIKLFNHFFPIPITWLIGHIHSEEEALSDTSFKMYMEIRHWFFGKLYEYNGEFEMESHNA